MKHAIRIAGALALLSGLVPAWAGDVTVKDTKNLIDDGIVDGSLTAIADKPHAYYKSRVKFVARFDKHGEIHQPFFTIFDSQTHVNFAAWDESTDLRTADGYGDVCRLLYLDRRRGDEMEALFALHKYQRFECVGVVQSVFNDQAFIEVLTLKPLDRTFAPDMHKRSALRMPQPSPHSHSPETAEPCDNVHTPAYSKGAASTSTATPTNVQTTETVVTTVNDASNTSEAPAGTIPTSHPDVVEVVPVAPANPPVSGAEGNGAG